MLPDASQEAPNRVPGWLTTATDHKIEIWHTNFLGVPAAVGTQFAELNANQVSTLYQDLETIPGVTLYWSLYHRGRNGVDVMALDIGAPGEVIEQELMSDDNTAWRRYSGTYTVPDGQTLTRFAFRSVSAAGGNRTVGNFLDGVASGVAPQLVLSKTVTPEETVEAGEPLVYRVTALNQGGAEAENVVLTDTVPPGTTYVPGSLVIVDGPNAGAMSDLPGDDQAHYDSDKNRVVFRLGNGATATQGGSLPNTDTLPQGTTIEFQVRADLDAADTDVTNQAFASYENRLGTVPEELTAVSGTVLTRVTRPPVEGEYTKLACYPQPWPSTGHICNYRFTVTSHEAPVDRWEISFRLHSKDEPAPQAYLYVNPGESVWYDSVDPDETDFVTSTSDFRETENGFRVTRDPSNRFVLRAKPGHRIEAGQQILVDVRLLHPTRAQADATELVDVRVTEHAP
ncbi:hypothetical protein [Streptomyces sp. NBC_00122]|uniref:hypothetical protein n=1 Tax=Streptomyces sp. NBC_00122 TaxID=2903623 RepID=UPI00386F5CD0